MIIERPMTDAELERVIDATLRQRAAVLEDLYRGASDKLAGMAYPLWHEAASAILARPIARAAFPGLTPATFDQWLRAAVTGALRRLTAPATTHADPAIASVARGLTEIALRADQALTQLEPAFNEYRGRLWALRERHVDPEASRKNGEVTSAYKKYRAFDAYDDWLVAGAAALRVGV